MIKILLVEDDYQQEEAILAAIRKEFPESEIETICTELEFRQSLNRIAASPPDLVILDMMIRWTDPSPGLQHTSLPAEVKEGGYYRAGVRCERLLREQAGIEHTPVIMYSILESKDLGKDLPDRPGLICYLSKGSDPKALLEKIRYWTRRRATV